MKKIIPHKATITFALFTVGFIVLVSSSGGGTGGGGGTSVGPITITSPETSPCGMKAVDLGSSLFFNSVSLRYDFQSYSSMTAVLAPDFAELARIHPSMSLLQSGTLSGEIEWLSEITNMSDMVSDESSKPKISIQFSDVECEAVGYMFQETEIEPSQVSGNSISNVHAYSTPLSYITYKIRSVKTPDHNVQLVWEGTINVTNIIYNIIDEAVIESDLSAFATVSTCVLDDIIACRLDPEDQSLVVIDIGENMTIEDLNEPENWAIEKDAFYFSPDLEGPVYSGGDLNEEIEWEKPIIISEQRP